MELVQVAVDEVMTLGTGGGTAHVGSMSLTMPVFSNFVAIQSGQEIVIHTPPPPKKGEKKEARKATWRTGVARADQPVFSHLRATSK